MPQDETVSVEIPAESPTELADRCAETLERLVAARADGRQQAAFDAADDVLALLTPAVDPSRATAGPAMLELALWMAVMASAHDPEPGVRRTPVTPAGLCSVLGASSQGYEDPGELVVPRPWDATDEFASLVAEQAWVEPALAERVARAQLRVDGAAGWFEGRRRLAAGTAMDLAKAMDLVALSEPGEDGPVLLAYVDARDLPQS